MARFILDINPVNRKMSETEAKNVSEMISEYLIGKYIGKGIITINPIDLTNENQEDNFINEEQLREYNKIIGIQIDALSYSDLVRVIEYLNDRLQLRDAEKISFNQIPIGSCFAYYEDLGSKNIPIGKKKNENEFYSYLKEKTYLFDEELKDEKLFVCVVHRYYGPSIHEVPDKPIHHILIEKPFNVLGMNI